MHRALFYLDSRCIYIYYNIFHFRDYYYKKAPSAYYYSVAIYGIRTY